MKTRIQLVRLVTLTALAAAVVLCWGTASASASVACSPGQICAPHLDLQKYAENGGWVLKGQPAHFSYFIHNDGDTALTGITLTDDKCAPVNDVTDPPD